MKEGFTVVNNIYHKDAKYFVVSNYPNANEVVINTFDPEDFDYVNQLRKSRFCVGVWQSKGAKASNTIINDYTSGA